MENRSIDISSELAKDQVLIIRLTGEDQETLSKYCRENRITKSELTRKAIFSVIDHR